MQHVSKQMMQDDADPKAAIPLNDGAAAVNANVASSSKSKDVWERRFALEGRIWGDEPSPPARYLVRAMLQNNAQICEVGAGYCRDSSYFVESGHRVKAIDRAANALTIATESVFEKIRNRELVFMAADFRDAAIAEKSQDVFFSHRVLHLLGNNGVTETFGRMAAKVLKPGGHLLVTARSPADFNPKQMEWVNEADAVAKYKETPSLGDRRGQLLYFWNEEKLRKLFGNDFTDMTFVEDTEIESVNNVEQGEPVLTHYISIAARRTWDGPSSGAQPS